ncbi:MAG TPA: tRNA (adenosine(37)-N6)-dimethylallyltransferase MiaA [Candidatus Acidoferrales bacterium]
MSALPRLVVLLGPTASGKSALGIYLAEKLGGEIVVCDSTQVYRHFDIGTAKVPAAEQRGIRHHLVDIVEPAEVFTAGDYRRHALEALGDLRRRQMLPILTAGTGLYLRALLEGLADAPQRSEEIRARLRLKAEQRGPQHLHRALARLDPESAARISAADTQKIIRAIELRLLTGKPVGEIHRSGRDALQGYEVIKLGLLPPRAALYARIHTRTAAMLAAGWLEEVRALVASGVSADAKPFQFIGYSQLREHLAGRLKENDAVQQIQQATRRFAKRQLTWFRKESGVHWLAGFGDAPEISAAALAIVNS